MDVQYYVMTTADSLSIPVSGFYKGPLGYRNPFTHERYSGSANNIMIPLLFDGIIIIAIWQDVFRNASLSSFYCTTRVGLHD